MPADVATKAYVESRIAEAIAASQTIIAAPLATLDDLRNFNMTSVKDKQMIYVEEVKKIYAYDLEGEGVDDGGMSVITPIGGIGRWFPTTPGTLDGGVY